MRNFIQQNWTIFIKGLTMGAADVVPGVSGGTIAFILGIFERLLTALSALNLTALHLLLRRQFKQFWRYLDGSFLLVLFSGILVSIFSLTQVIVYLLEHHPIPLWAFFNGLILASLPLLLSKVNWSLWRINLFILGALSAFCFTLLTPMQANPTPLMFYGAGFLAICALILPGISGSFLLLVIGMYVPVTSAVSNLDFATLLLFAFGCATGLITFSRFLKWALQRAYHAMLAFLSGVILGASYRIWPWQLDEQAVSPFTYAATFGHAQLGLAFIAFMLGIGILFLLRLLERT